MPPKMSPFVIFINQINLYLHLALFIQASRATTGDNLIRLITQ